MNKKIVASSFLGMAALLGGLSLADKADAYRGDYTQKGPNYNEERHQQMEEAFKNNDYNAWKELMNGRGRVTQVVNESNFARFAEAHNLAQEARYDEAEEIRSELGLRTRNGEPTGQGYGKGNGQGQMRNQNQ
jgi:hypothetical protein